MSETLDRRMILPNGFVLPKGATLEGAACLRCPWLAEHVDVTPACCPECGGAVIVSYRV